MKKTIYKHLFVLFFILMFIFTIISRVMDTMMTAKVETGRIQRKTINCAIQGEGVVEAVDIELVTSHKGYRIERVSVLKGSKITPDTELFQYEMDSIKTARKKAQNELDKLKLELKQAQLSAQIIPWISQAEVSQMEIQAAEKELASAQENYDEKVEKHQKTMKDLQDRFERKKHLTQDQLEYQNEKSYLGNVQNYNTVRANRDGSIKEAERKVEDAERELSQLEEENADDRELSKARETLDRALEDLEELQEYWDEALEDAEEQLESDEIQADNISSGWTLSQISLEEEYGQNLEREEQGLLDAEEQVEKAANVLEQLKQNMVISQKKDAAAQAEYSQQRQAAQLTQESLRMDIETKTEEIARIDELLKQQGIIRAGLSGTVVKVDLAIGQVTTGEETVQIATGNYRIRGTFQKDGDVSIQAGNEVAITAGDDSLNVTVDVVDLSQDDLGEFVAEADFKNPAVGMIVQYKYAQKSHIYQKVIPLSAIHKDLKGYYCLSIQEENGILGTEFTAARINLEVIFSGTTEAAVEGNLGQDTRIIVETDRAIKEGDRVRPVKKI